MVSTKGDRKGEYTCYSSPANLSVIDLALASGDMRNRVLNFKVDTLLADISDHCSVQADILIPKRIDLRGETLDPNLVEVSTMPISWSAKANEDVTNCLREASTTKALNDIIYGPHNSKAQCVCKHIEHYTLRHYECKVPQLKRSSITLKKGENRQSNYTRHGSMTAAKN